MLLLSVLFSCHFDRREKSYSKRKVLPACLMLDRKNQYLKCFFYQSNFILIKEASDLMKISPVGRNDKFLISRW